MAAFAKRQMHSSEYLRFAERLARKAGALLSGGRRRQLRIELKGAIDLVTEMDLKSEQLIQAEIRNRFPHHDLLTEERFSRQSGAEYRWIVDPLDGTTNYAHGHPIWCVSIALEFRGEIVLGVVYDPNQGELFRGSKGQGAFLNERRIRVSHTNRLDRSLLATGFPYDVRTSRKNNLADFARFYRLTQGVRRGGSAALDICYTAAGRFDGYWELKLAPWDSAAAGLIALEAGARVTDFSGGRHDPFKREILVTNGRIHRAMLTVLSKK